jgi:hypothetical protein
LHLSPTLYADLQKNSAFVSLRWSSGMAPPITALPFARGFCASHNSRRNQSGASAIGAAFPQRYLSPPAWSDGKCFSFPDS